MSHLAVLVDWLAPADRPCRLAKTSPPSDTLLTARNNNNILKRNVAYLFIACWPTYRQISKCHYQIAKPLPRDLCGKKGASLFVIIQYPSAFALAPMRSGNAVT